ncbi:MAG: sugar phosphate isomerase/epimerase, partial [Opitutaceae bacterium]|nr:sugar phosphate isomerase/epimerase [Opitutaceae bacterium]
SAAVRAVIERANHKRLAALWDIMHPMRKQESPLEAFTNLGPHTRHVHIHDAVYTEEGKLKITPLGEGLFDHVESIHLLLKNGYDGYYSMEVIQQRGKQEDSDGVMQQHAEKIREIVEQA